MPTVSRLLLAIVLALALSGPARAQYAMDSVSLIGAIQSGDYNEAAAGVDRANHVYVVRVSQLMGIKLNGQRLDRAISQRSRVLRYFRAAIRGAREARRALEIHGEALEDVVFATFTNDGGATLYVDDR